MIMTDTEDDLRYGVAPPRRYYGKYAGLVIDNGPPEGGPHRGQVQVKVPGILEEAAGGLGSRPLEVLAAPAFLPGFFFVPEQGATVWVEFVAGDINYPIWTGVWYPEGRAPQAIDPAEPTRAGAAATLDQKVIRTRSGQVVQLDDTSGGEQIVVRDEASGSSVTLGPGGITIGALASGGSLTLQFGGQEPTATVVLEDRKITLTAGGSGGSSITLDASAGITLKTSGVTVTIDSTKMNVA